MATADQKLSDLRIEINDLRNDLKTSIVQTHATFTLIERSIEHIVTKDNLPSSEYIIKIKENINNLRDDVNKSYVNTHKDIDELTDTMTGIAKSINDILTAKNNFNQNFANSGNEVWLIFPLIPFMFLISVKASPSKYFVLSVNIPAETVPLSAPTPTVGSGEVYWRANTQSTF